MGKVRTGLDRFVAASPDRAGLSDGARLGLLAHAASVDRNADHAIDLIRERTPFRVMRLFAPEHGLSGTAQDMESVADGTDASSDLPVISLYGSDARSLRPRPDQLEGLDAVVCDLQDVGSRYYTFVYTVAYVMEAAAEAGLPLVVLDRPNPIGGLQLEGPPLDPALSSFVGRFPLPVRHGLTAGELASLFREFLDLDVDLRVVPMAGWRRRMDFERTGLPWVPPSPNMPQVSTAHVYPGGCLVEGTNLSEGRGTTTPFELVGAPWLDSQALERALETATLPAARFRAATFRPMFQKHAGTACRGVQVAVIDRASFRPFATYLVLLREARRLGAGHFDWRREPYEFETERLAIDLLLGRRELRPMIEAGETLEDMEASWSAELETFAERRERFLLYPS